MLLEQRGYKIILTSSHIHEDDLTSMLKEGLSGFLEKPYTDEEIENLIIKLLD